MRLIILVIAFCCGSSLVNSARCPNNPQEKIVQFGEISRQIGLRQVSEIQPLCGKVYEGLNTVIDIMKYCEKYKNSEYRIVQKTLFSSLYSVCPPVGLDKDASELMDKTGGDCVALKGECARLASQTLDDGDGERGEVCRSHKPTVECGVIYAKRCMGSENKLYTSAFASYLRYYVSNCRNTQKTEVSNQQQSPSNQLSTKRCSRLSKKCSKIAQKANVKNCSIMKKSYRCLDKFVKACKWMLSPETLTDIQLSRSDLYNQCSTGNDMMMGDSNKKGPGSELSKAKCNLKVKHCSDMIIDANSVQYENCRNAKVIKECLQTVLERCSNTLDIQLITTLKTTQQDYQKCISDPCPNPVRDYEYCEDLMNGINPNGLCKKGSETLKCYSDYMERCENKMTEYMRGGVTSFRKMLNDNGCLSDVTK